MPTRTGTLARGTGWQELRPPVLLRGKAALTKVCVYGPFQLHNISFGPLRVVEGLFIGYNDV